MRAASSAGLSLPASSWIAQRPCALDASGPEDVHYDANSARELELIGGIELIERTALKFPNKVAVDDGHIQLTYAQFIDRVYGLAARLIERTEGGSVIASIVSNTAASPVIIMACAFAGRILVPIDASHPQERQEAIYSQSGASAVLLDNEVAGEHFVPKSIPRLVVDPRLETRATRPPHHWNPRAPLFVSFTSGSTGRPKGVASGGRYGISALRQFIDMFHLNASDVVIGLASLSTGGARDAFAVLGVGATIRLVDIKSGGFSEALRVLEEDKVTVLSFIPSALRAILSIEGAEKAFRYLRVLDLHGERVLASDIALFRRKLPSTCHISVTMGSIESGALFSWFVRDEALDGPVVPVGYLMPGRQIALLNADGQPVSDGEVGELLARGPMALGAWRDGRLTPGPFLVDPGDPDSRIYRMGDLVRQRRDGLFEYIARSDRKVKVHGLWADLGEVEAALRTMAGVNDAVALVEADSPQSSLIAFIVMDDGVTPPTPGEVRRTVAAETAEHMAPAEVHVLKAIPRLANFKPDLMKLRERSGDGLAS
jgi:acyl-coenzyme A synthetase/AMP-(fatty) acid ligase